MCAGYDSVYGETGSGNTILRKQPIDIKTTEEAALRIVSEVAGNQQTCSSFQRLSHKTRWERENVERYAPHKLDNKGSHCDILKEPPRFLVTKQEKIEFTEKEICILYDSKHRNNLRCLIVSLKLFLPLEHRARETKTF